jgi:hypothetical protein
MTKRMTKLISIVFALGIAAAQEQDKTITPLTHEEQLEIQLQMAQQEINRLQGILLKLQICAKRGIGQDACRIDTQANTVSKAPEPKPAETKGK